jgi:hypothetical protein
VSSARYNRAMNKRKRRIDIASALEYTTINELVHFIKITDSEHNEILYKEFDFN